MDILEWLVLNGKKVNGSEIERLTGAPLGTVSKFVNHGRPLGKWEQPIRQHLSKWIEATQAVNLKKE